MTWQIINGDCVEAMNAMDECSVDSIVTDPPYGIGFMGKAWDCAVPGDAFAKAAIRVLRPGGHLIAFAATRTVHRLTCALEDAGFDVRDQIAWLQWQGFPKSLDVSKAIDSHFGAEREQVGKTTAPRKALSTNDDAAFGYGVVGDIDVTVPSTPEAKQWNGWGTALKPAYEPAILVRKPLDGTVANNVLTHGTGGLNIDGCRYAYGDRAWPGPNERNDGYPNGPGGHMGFSGANERNDAALRSAHWSISDLGRWPANIYHCPKPSRGERDNGCESIEPTAGYDAVDRKEGSAGLDNPRAGAGRTASHVLNHHATVKPIRLMDWLVRLITPPGGLCLDPFLGSGTTGVAALRVGVNFIGIEIDPEYVKICRARMIGDSPLFNRLGEK